MVGSRGTEPPPLQGFRESLTYQKSQVRAPPTSCHPKVPDRQPHGPVVSRPPAVLAKGLVLRARRKQGCGSDCCLGREIHPGMGRVPGRFRLNSSAEISLEPLPCQPGLWELSSWFGWDGGGEAGGGRWEAGEEH